MLRGKVALLAIAWCGGIVGVATIAGAQPKHDERTEERRTKLYGDARELGTRGRWQEAREKLNQVVTIRSSPKALIALAYAELQLGHLRESHKLYRRARDDARASAIAEDVSAAEAGIDHVKQRIPSIVLKLPDEVAAHEIRVGVDRRHAIVVNGVVEVDPGERHLLVTAPGHVPFQTTVQVAEGSRLEVPVRFRKEQQPPELEESAADPSARETRGAPLGPILLGVAGLGVGGVGALVWLGGNADYDAVVDECEGGSCPASKQATLAPRADDARSKIQTGQVLVGVGAATMVGAAIWWAASAGTSESAGSRRRLFVGAAPLHRGWAAAFSGKFE